MMNSNTLIAPTVTRSVWPIAITLYFLVAFSGVVSFIVWSVHQKQELVSVDYYKDEILFQQRLDAINRALPFGDQIGLQIQEDPQLVTLFIPLLHAAARPIGTIQFYRPSEAKLDFQVPLVVGSDGRQTLDSRLLKAGFWKSRVEWTFAGENYLFEKAFLVPKH
jgi:hypothetical protein